MTAWVYILKCADRSYYTGVTTDLDQRMIQHANGELAEYTSTRRPVELVWTNEFQDINEARSFETRVKRWSRTKKEALIRGDFAALPRLSARGFRPARQR